MVPQTQYARSGDIHIAYQVLGDGPQDIVVVPGWLSHLEYGWTEPSWARFLRRLATFSRVIIFDKRGTGLSDRLSRTATFDERMEDVRAVMDAAGSERASLIGVSEGGPLSCLFAATYPKRTRALVLYGTYAKWLRTDDFQNVPTLEEHEHAMQAYMERWGSAFALRLFAPSRLNDPTFRDWWAGFLRTSASPSAAVALHKMNIQIDVRHLLPTIRVPTLVLHRTGDILVSIEQGRYIAASIPDARLVELPGQDHLIFLDADDLLDEIEKFLTGELRDIDPDLVVGTILFTDIVGSTEMAARIGDVEWRRVLETYFKIVRDQLASFRGNFINSTGDGFLGTFDGPVRAVQCACAIRDAAKIQGIETRSGLYTGEYNLLGDNIGGISVHIAARIMNHAGDGQVWVSESVKNLTSGSEISYEDCGIHTLKGVPGDWQLYNIAS